jgi:hypothetical protein
MRQEFLVRIDTLYATFPPPDEGDLVTPVVVDMTVKTVCSDVEFCIREPPGIRVLPFPDSIPGPDPLELASHFAPERIRVCEELVIHLLVIPNPGILLVFRSRGIIFHLLNKFDIKVFSHALTNFTLLIM